MDTIRRLGIELAISLPKPLKSKMPMNAMAQPAAPLQTSGWSAALELQFESRGGRTVLTHNRHEGPLRVQRPFYPECGGQAHVYILHPPGGIVAGDSLAITARFHSGAHALLTTPSAGRVYRSNTEQLLQSQQVKLHVGDGGFGEWLPQETILFDAALARNHTQIELEGSARFIGWEITCLGRPASGLGFERGSLDQRLAICRDGRLLLLERSLLDGGSPMLQAAWGLQGFTTLGTLVCASRDKDLLRDIKTCCEDLQPSTAEPHLRIAATQLPELVIVRGLADNAAPLRNAFIHCWRVMRRHLVRQEAVPPRIWFT